ncbi:MAG TPA: hypothetical protein VFA75_08565 [Nevskia sp.]|jgi:hypothetical protein|nr:hypothetical protein [Nevskia sp.]
MDQHGLSDEEWLCLERYARDRQDTGASLEVLARLEQLGLLMRGWGPTYVVTARGEALLREGRTQARR